MPPIRKTGQKGSRNNKISPITFQPDEMAFADFSPKL